MPRLPSFLNNLVDVSRVEDANQAHLLKKYCRSYGFNGKAAPSDHYQYNKQVHGTAIIKADRGRESASEPADGIYTSEEHFKIAVRTADCLPVLFAAESRAMVMAVHAGWRGLTAGILTAAVKQFAASGTPAENIYAAVGPAISRACYEVGPEVVTALFSGAMQMELAASAACVAKGRSDRWYLDLQSAAVLNLTACGVPAAHIEVIDICTYSTDSFNSYRREGKGVGSNISWISL